MATKRPGGTAARRRGKTATRKAERVFENPLLPHKKLQEMYAAMLQCRLLERSFARRANSRRGKQQSWKPFAGREASLIATMHNLLPEDHVSLSINDPAARFLRGESAVEVLRSLHDGAAKNKKSQKNLKNGKETGILPPVDGATARLALAAGVALAAKAAKECVVVAYLTAPEAGEDWLGVLEAAVRLQLPMVFLCEDDGRKSAAARKARDAAWKRLCAASTKIELPVIPVDGEDLIAMYRVAQEAIGRARMGIGSTVIWCCRWKLGLKRADPLTEFEGYLKQRRLFSPESKRRIVAAFHKKMKQA